MDVFGKLRTIDNLTHSENILVNYILNDPQSFLILKPKDIAANNFISVATIYRLLEKLGYNGVTNFKIDLAAGLIKKQKHSDMDIDVNYPIKPTDNSREIVDNLSELYRQTIVDTETLINYSSLVECVNTLKKAKHIDVYTNSSNTFFAHNFKFQMQEIGLHVNVPEEEYIQNLYAANSTKESVAIVISYGGRSHNLHNVVEILKGNQAKIILITSTQHNPLSLKADHLLYLASDENHYNKISSFSSRFSVLFLLDLIYSSFFHLDFEKNINYKRDNYLKIHRVTSSD